MASSSDPGWVDSKGEGRGKTLGALFVNPRASDREKPWMDRAERLVCVGAEKVCGVEHIRPRRMRPREK